MSPNRTCGKRLLKCLLFLIALGILCYGLLILYVCYEEENVALPTRIPDAIIVLGSQVLADGTPSVQLSLRLEAAYQAYIDYDTNPFIVTCGAQGHDEPRPEAVVMKEWLVERGIPAERILIDDASFNTKQNIQNAKALLDGHDVHNILIITSDYHLPRALRLAQDTGFDAEGIGSPCYPEYWAKNHVREALAWVKYWMQKYIGFPKG